MELPLPATEYLLWLPVMTRVHQAAMRTFQATLKQEDLEDLQKREQEGREAFLKWKKQKAAEERRKKEKVCVMRPSSRPSSTRDHHRCFFLLPVMF